jgi:hypothetical protein
LVDENDRLKVEIAAIGTEKTAHEASIAALKKELSLAEKESQVNKKKTRNQK